MYNMNSPTLQAMLQNTPQGVGNMPMYSGSTPIVTTSQQQFNSPYPSPKDMVIQSGQQTVYAPVGFGSPYPQNIVGGYNPNIQHSAFNGYSNPYMGYGSYGGYGYQQQYIPDHVRDTCEVAAMNGVTYQEQVEMHISVHQFMSSVASKNLGLSEEEAKAHKDFWDPRIRAANEQKQQKEAIRRRRPLKLMHVRIKCGDEVVADIVPDDTDVRELNLIKDGNMLRRVELNVEYERQKRAYIRQRMYDMAPERLLDNMDLGDIFTGGLAQVQSIKEMQEIRMQRMINSSNVYNRDKFHERLMQNNGFKSRRSSSAIERYVGRYGVMPDGRPVTPGLDPAVAQSFSYNVNTGQYEVRPPKFLTSKIEAARQSFLQTLDNG